MANCPSCGYDYIEEEYFCPRCGTILFADDSNLDLEKLRNSALNFVSSPSTRLEGAEYDAAKAAYDKAKATIIAAKKPKTVISVYRSLIQECQDILANAKIGPEDRSRYDEDDALKIEALEKEFREHVEKIHTFRDISSVALLLRNARDEMYSIKTTKQKKEELDDDISAVYERASKGNRHAMYELALIYQRGVGVTKSPIDAFIWFEKAAKKGHPQAMEALGDCYFHGEGTAVDFAKAEKWYLKAAKAQGVK
ncbi:MAG: SEL1-like repeat protein [Bacilli bacterium]|nr:SEL1-like repeat protein [Bacilli bacterium]